MRLLPSVFIVLLVSVSGAVKTKNPDVSSRVSCETTKGPLLIEIYRDWAPLGADRFLELVRDGFYTDIALFRCVRDFLTQFGISDKPKYKHWHNKNIPDDPPLHIPIRKNYLSYAGGGANTRSTQLFIAFEDLNFLGKEPWETPFGMVVEGQATLDSFYKDYGDIPPFGAGPDQQKLHNKGNDYIRSEFPNTDFILSCQEIGAEAAGNRDLEGKEEEEGEAERDGGELAQGQGEEEEGEEEEGELGEQEEGEEEEEEEGVARREREEVEGEEEEEGEPGEQEEGEEGEQGEEGEEGEQGEEGEEEFIESPWSQPPAVVLVAAGLFLGISLTYIVIRRNKALVAENKSN